MSMRVVPRVVLDSLWVAIVGGPANRRIGAPVVVEELLLKHANVAVVDVDVGEREEPCCSPKIQLLRLNELAREPVHRAVAEILPPQCKMALIVGACPALERAQLLDLVECFCVF